VLEFLLALLTTATVGVLLVPLLRRTARRATERLDNDLAIYRDQLAEIERELQAGTLSQAEATAARTEIERRILTSADRDQGETRRQENISSHPWLVPGLCLAIPLLALGVYLQIGRPGLPAAPFVAGAGRIAPQDDAAGLAKMIADAKERAKASPDDPAALSGLGEALTTEADGTVTEPAVQAFAKALAKNPDDPRAIYYLGLHEAQAGDSAAALKRWRALEARSPPEAPYLPMLRAEIAKAARAAGMPQPSTDQMAAMGKLSPEERIKAIRGMVEGLDQRLRQGGDRPEDRDSWLRLANARKVLGENDKAAEAYAKADKLQPLDNRLLAEWAEVEVRQIKPGTAPSAEAIQVLERLEKAEPSNALALFYLGAASFAKGDKAEAARRWKMLLAELPPDAPIRALLEQKIKEAE
jgi:cytochrome c-type biogenesis protein CcmH